MSTYYDFEIFNPGHPNTFSITIAVTATAMTWQGSGPGFETRSGIVSFSQTGIRFWLGSGVGTSTPFLTLRTPSTGDKGVDSWPAGKEGRCLNDNLMDTAQTSGHIPDKQNWRWRYLGKR